MNELERLRADLVKLRRFNNILIVIVTVLILAGIANWGLSRTEMADLMEYRERYGSLEKARYEEWLKTIPETEYVVV